MATFGTFKRSAYVGMYRYVVCAIAGCDSLISNGHSRYCKAHQVYRLKNRYRLTDPLPEKAMREANAQTD